MPFVPCKEHQYRDPVTNRCRNNPDYKPTRTLGGEPGGEPGKQYKPCKEHQYRDPVTNRCRNNPDSKPTRKKPSKQSKVLGEDRLPIPPKWNYIPPREVGDCIKRSKLPLRDAQMKVIQYMNEQDGLLVMHSTGTGKTLTAITASQCYLDKNPGSKVVFVGPSSLLDNFRKEMGNYGLSISSMENYEMYSFDKFYQDVKAGKPPDLTNKMLIVDEAHNLRNPSSVKSQAIVEASTVASKRMLLTATPFVNSLIDFIPLINIIYGRKIVGSQLEFNEGYVQEYLTNKTSEDNLATLKYLLRDKIDILSLPKSSDYPERIDVKKFVPMSLEYYDAYNRIITGEQVLGMVFTNPDKFYNAYRRAVNQAGTDYYSSKIRAGINIFSQGKTLIYTNWVEFGINPITEELKKVGITYRLFYGETPVAERQSIVNDFNNDRFQVLVVTKAGGEGLDLKGVRNVVVMEPTWNDAGLQQIIGRAIRYKSHEHLPEEERNVHVYFMMLSIPVELQLDDGVEEKPISGDQILYNIISEKNELNVAIKEILQDISI